MSDDHGKQADSDDEDGAVADDIAIDDLSDDEEATLLHDFAKRKRASILANHGTTVLHLGTASQMSQMLALASVKLHVASDRLYNRLVQCLTRFFRQEGIWTCNARERFVVTAREIMRHKRGAVSLQGQVRQIAILAQLRPQTALLRMDRGETTDERRERLEDFWEDYKSPRAAHVPRFGLRDLDIQPPEEQQEHFQGSSPRSSTLRLKLPQLGPALPKLGRSADHPLSSRRSQLSALRQDRLQSFATKLPKLPKLVFSLPRIFADARQSPGLEGALNEESALNVYPGSEMSSLMPMSATPFSCSSPAPEIPAKTKNLRKKKLRSFSPRGGVGKEAEGAPSIDALAKERECYLRFCDVINARPLTLPFVTGHSPNFVAADRSLVDQDLQPLMPLIEVARDMQVIDLARNRLLTDVSFVPFLAALSRNRFLRSETSPLLRLNLSECKGFGKASVSMLMKQLANDSFGICSLRSLNINRVQIPMPSCLALAEVLGKHPCLQRLDLVDIGMSSTRLGPVACSKCIAALLRSETLQVLDLSWNVLGKEAFASLGECLVGHRHFKGLSLVGCSSVSMAARDQPVEYFLELLAKNTTITSLDLTMNHIDYRGAFIIEDCLEEHKALKSLIISDNPLGSGGARSLVRLLSRDKAGLTELTCLDCISPASLTDPSGKYILDLERPYHRALLRRFYKVCESLSISYSSAFVDISYGSQTYHHAHKRSGLWDVPKQGRLELVFSMHWAGLEDLQDTDDWDFSSFVQHHLELRRLKPSLAKAAALFSFFKANAGNKNEQLMLLDVFAKDFLLRFQQVEEMSHTKDCLIVEVLSRTLPCILGGRSMRYLSLLLLPSLTSLVQVLSRSRNFLTFNVENPTGHYRLELSLHSDYAVAEQLLLINRWEADVEQRLQRQDTSELGNRSHLRNVTLGSLPITDIWELVLPDREVLKCDYVTGKRPHPEMKHLNDTSFAKVLQLMLETDNHGIRISAGASVSHYLAVSSLQLREVLGLFDSKELQLQQLGYATFFPFMQPEFTSMSLDFSRNDQRIAANIFLQLHRVENMKNIKDYGYVDGNGVEDQMLLGIPSSWQDLERMPTAGVFRMTYTCAADNRKFANRKVFMERFGFFKRPFQETDTMWWSSLSEAPEDVREFMEFLIGNFPDLIKPFEVIDGFHDCT
ncbi:unnamed protein product [Polarella glacialis]|uniref:Uncharacterized protein n=1 Tax=Polarella glacialis TaxID=89957 RepID=A0A813ENR2_POLGL|nr:unnamed protein product [Polarella glacialis]